MKTYDILSPLLPEHASQTALVFHGRKTSYASVSETVSCLANGLAKKFSRGTILAIWLPNSPELLYLYLACFRTGIVPMPMHEGMKWPEVQNILRLSKARYLITTHKIVVQHAADIAASGLEQVYVVEPENLQKPFIDYADLLKSDGEVDAPVITSDTPALILLTSGSDGQPKAVKLSHANLAHILEYRLTHTGLSTKSISAVASCLTQSVGLYQSLALLAARATLLLLESYDIDQMAKLVNRCRPTHLIMTVDAFDKLVHYPDITESSFSNLVFAAAGADRVTPHLQDRFIQLTGKPLWITYGLTESSWALVNKGESSEKRLALGKPCPGVEIKLSGRDGQEVCTGAVGEIHIRSPRTMLGYLHNDVLTRNTIVDGWLTTGDLAYRDADGYYWFAGRCKNLIVLNTGDNVSPAEIENAILDHPDVTNCVVINNTSEHGSEEAWAFVVSRNENLSDNGLMTFLEQRLSDHKLPRRIIFLPELPLGLTGKISRFACQKFSASDNSSDKKQRITA